VELVHGFPKGLKKSFQTANDGDKDLLPSLDIFPIRVTIPTTPLDSTATAETFLKNQGIKGVTSKLALSNSVRPRHAPTNEAPEHLPHLVLCYHLDKTSLLSTQVKREVFTGLAEA
jgi:hypothetical protein